MSHFKFFLQKKKVKIWQSKNEVKPKIKEGFLLNRI